jgi:hypothetical protein
MENVQVQMQSSINLLCLVWAEGANGRLDGRLKELSEGR